MQVEVKGDIEGAIRFLKKKIAQSGLLKELRVRQYYMTKSQKRRWKNDVSRKRKQRGISQRLKRDRMGRAGVKR